MKVSVDECFTHRNNTRRDMFSKGQGEFEMIAQNRRKPLLPPAQDDPERRWQEWAISRMPNASRSTLRPYISIESANFEKQLIAELTALTPYCRFVAYVLVVLDGSPEHSRRMRNKSEEDGVIPQQAVEAKDTPFFLASNDTMCLFGGLILGHDDDLEELETPQERLYQDGCAAVFQDEKSAFAAIVSLHRELAIRNQVRQLRWEEQLHARVSVGKCWEAAVRGLPQANRDETIIDPEISHQTKAETWRFLVALGMRDGPGSLEHEIKLSCALAHVKPFAPQRRNHLLPSGLQEHLQLRVSALVARIVESVL